MKKLSLATALITSLFAMGANAYQYEVNVGYENTDIEDLGDLDTWSASGKYYLNAIQTKSSPLAEAAFLSRGSNIGLGYVNASGDGDEDIDVYGVSGEFFIPNSQFYFSGSLNQVDLGGEDNTGYTVEAGYLPVNGLLLALGVSKESLDPVLVAENGFVTSLGYAAAVGEDTTVSTRGKYVTQIGGFYTNFEGVVYFGDETAYKLGGDLYLDPTLSVGASFADSTADESETIFGINAKKFFTPQIGVGVAYTTADDVDSVGINGTFRF